MPLRDHFRSPLNDKRSWDELHGQWPAMIVQSLYHLLPEGYVAAPSVHLGAPFEVDVSTYQEDEPSAPADPANGGEGSAAVTWKAPSPPSSTIRTMASRPRSTTWRLDASGS